MSVLPLIYYPDLILKQTAKKIEKIDDNIKVLAHNMLETLYENSGIGLAGNQVGELLRIVVIDLQLEEDNNEPLFLINPEIIWKSKDIDVSLEGCLSIPGVSENVNRYSKIKVSYLDLKGNVQSIECDDLLSYCIQHEIDHLNGILFINRISKLKRDLLLKKYKKHQQHDTK